MSGGLKGGRGGYLSKMRCIATEIAGKKEPPTGGGRG